MQIAPAGDRALLVTLPGASSAHLRAVSENARKIAGVVAAIVGHESVYVIGTSDADALRAAVDTAHASEIVSPRRHRIEVSFHESHALDLDQFLTHVRVSRDEFLRRVESIHLTVRYLGFRAGFAYLEGWPAEWAMPRRATSRNRIPGGSFGIAASMSGFYPVDSPGGWNILGRTAAPLWDPLRDPPNLFAPGDEISILVAQTLLSVPEQTRVSVPQHHGEPIAEVISPGQLTTVVGAPDWARLEHGQALGGPFDEEAATIANAAVGNPPSAPLLECVIVGPKLRLMKRAVFCDADLTLRDASDVGRIEGMRGYLAIEGGIEEIPTILRKGDTLWSVAAAFRPPIGGLKPAATRGDRLTIRIRRGPHDSPPLPAEWEVTRELNRVGIRMRPIAPIDFKPPADLPSCGAQFGTIQWHADGSIVALGPDHPVTGGYLQPATVLSTELWKLAQLAPGDRVKLIAV